MWNRRKAFGTHLKEKAGCNVLLTWVAFRKELCWLAKDGDHYTKMKLSGCSVGVLPFFLVSDSRPPFLSQSYDYYWQSRLEDLAGSPLVKTPCFPWKGHAFHPWSGNEDRICCGQIYIYIKTVLPGFFPVGSRSCTSSWPLPPPPPSSTGRIFLKPWLL